MVRHELHYEGDEQTLYAMWKAIDANTSGFITQGEFGAFWRRGTAAVTRARAEARVAERAVRREQGREKVAAAEQKLYRERARAYQQRAEAMAEKAAELEAATRLYGREFAVVDAPHSGAWHTIKYD